jgi:hypothetical protein
MKAKKVYLILSIFLAVYAGVFIVSMIKNNQVVTPYSGNGAYKKPSFSKEAEGSLGIMNFSKSIYIGLKYIVENNGTSEDVLELIKFVETDLNQTLVDQNLDEVQEKMVQEVRSFIESVETLAINGFEPKEIFKEINSKKSDK